MSFEPYFDDELGLLSKWDGYTWDSSNSCFLTAFYRFGRYLKFKNDPEQLAREEGKFKQECDMLEEPTSPGKYVNNPSIISWSKRTPISSETLCALIITLGAFKQKQRLLDIFKANWTSISCLVVFIRALNMAGYSWVKLLWPVVALFDLLAFHFSQNFIDVFVMKTLQAKYSMPTPFSFLLRKVARNDDGLDPKELLAKTYTITTGNPPLPDLYLPLLEKEL